MAHPQRKISPDRYETVPLADLRPHPRNYQKHPEEQVAHLVERVRQFGCYRPVVTARDLTILAGHGLAVALQRVGAAEALVCRLDLDPDEPLALKCLAGDNESTRLAEKDDRQLAELLHEVEGGDLDGLLGTGFDAGMLAGLDALLAAEDPALPEPGAGGDSFDATPEPGPTRTNVGELWVIGGVHRLLVGDCTVAENVTRLMGGEKAGLIWSDPPYGVNHSGGSKDPRAATYRSGDKIQNDALDETSLRKVYDPFLGSGTTLIAAHRLNRRCYGCEIEPRYADVILRRAEAEGLTVEKAAT